MLGGVDFQLTTADCYVSFKWDGYYLPCELLKWLKDFKFVLTYKLTASSLDSPREKKRTCTNRELPTFPLVSDDAIALGNE